jgi:hypothetical protein
LVACPSCRSHLDRHERSCPSCGSRWSQHGSIVNFIGARASNTPNQSDLEIAEWLVAASPDLRPEYLKTISSQNHFPELKDDLDPMRGLKGRHPSSLHFMLTSSPITSDSIVLDAGCSVGRHLLELARACSELGVSTDRERREFGWRVRIAACASSRRPKKASEAARYRRATL